MEGRFHQWMTGTAAETVLDAVDRLGTCGLDGGIVVERDAGAQVQVDVNRVGGGEIGMQPSHLRVPPHVAAAAPPEVPLL
ncbi:hypothetical protein [Geotalea toluenoxydans]|uniref:hypothetical protein n=1 Tax=Geotalea toluenoxydans TaxID=421624 RepID=UPI001FB40C8F|nr:hypothetical protein [Geotalea toluenoxydans]